MGGSGPVRGLRQAAVPCTDVERSVAFYRDVVGLDLMATFGDLAFFAMGGVRLLVERSDGPAVAAGGVLYMEVSDIHAAHAALVERGVVFEDEPHAIFTDAAGTLGDAGEAEWMTFFRDPDGNLLALSSRQPPE